MPVIFDMDGVIADTQKIHSRIEAEMLASYGITISPTEITRRFSGRSLKDMFDAVFYEAGLPCPYKPEVSDLKAERFMDCVGEFVGIPGTLACIEQLHSRVPLAVASASRLPVIDLVLSTLKIKDKFTVLTSSREVKNGKPAPDVFLLAAQRLNATPSTCVVIEDGISGMLGARAAGMRCIALVSDDNTDYPADLIVHDLREVQLEWFD